MNLGSKKMDSNYTGMWVNFFTTAGIPSDVAATYALTFTENRIQTDMLLDLNKEYLRDMGITRMGDVIAILRHAKQVHESTARDRVLSTAVSNTKVPVAAVTGRSTSSPSSPASRILERYTRKTQVQEPTAAPAPPLKRKPEPGSIDRLVTDTDSNLKKARLIRFSSSAQPTMVKEVVSNKTVFARLGSPETSPQVSIKTVSTNSSAKAIYARLGSKTEKQLVPIERDALKYEGILKAVPTKKVVTVTTLRNNMRQIALGCTMRADETPVSVRDKLSAPKAKSVKFSNQVQYKEIETVKMAAQKVTTVFNKPERRLCMPDNNGIKARLGAKMAANVTAAKTLSNVTAVKSANHLAVAKNPNNLTITRNVFNRLGV